ncbi:small integral membrane protein 8 [Scaptodrosophila lebanonensis]|uniref:Small integral membrane protein 8 n=1 Tax=Drosophila lebanonensis TaxID=7225 RepID=A0A6J2U9Z4_DROLE|nr:small integral membrane protein 8 [Scaptodrosophila lebanonensis]
MSDSKEARNPGEGIRSLRSTSVFRLINFELYTKPNKIIMGLGLAAFAGVFGYIAYMRQKYVSLGYYAAVQENGQEVFTKQQSKWEQ